MILGIRICLDHYLELLWHEPGALVRSLPLRQARDRGEWPAAYDGLWKGLLERFDESEAACQMLCVLMLHRDYDADGVLVAVELGLEYGSVNAGAIATLVRQLSQTETRAAARRPGRRPGCAASSCETWRSSSTGATSTAAHISRS